MRTIKVLAILGLAVALVGVPALARDIVLTPPQGANDILIVATVKWVIVEAKWTKDGNPIRDIPELKDKRVTSIDVGFGNRFGTVKLDEEEYKLTPPSGANDILIVAGEEWIIKEAWWTQNGQKFGDKQIEGLAGQKFKSIHGATAPRVQVTITVVPTLTEWGLIALAVLLMGGMVYMIYRRRPALRPAAP